MDLAGGHRAEEWGAGIRQSLALMVTFSSPVHLTDLFLFFFVSAED